jgi:hypothetical protein
MTFDSLAQRCIMEQEWVMPDKDDPRRAEVQREIDEYEQKLEDLLITLPSGARYWGPLAMTPKSGRGSADPEKITREQAIDYGLPPKEYKFIGSGSESVVYGDDEYVYKLPRHRGFGRSHLGNEVSVDTPENQIKWKFRACRVAKDVDNLPPLELADIGPDKFFLHYGRYKDIKESGEVPPVDSKRGVSYDAASGKVIMPEGVRYHAGHKGFAVVNTYTFSSLNLRCMDNGILVQDILPRDATNLSRNEKMDLVDHMEKKNGIHVDKRNIGNNIKKGESVIYVMD